MNWYASYLCQLARGRFRFDGRRLRKMHVLLALANHFEPGWQGVTVSKGLERMRYWIPAIESMADLRDCYNSRLKQTYFFPLEQYEEAYMTPLVHHARKGFGEIEVHLHHGLESPDTASGLKSALLEFLGVMAKRHEWVVEDRAGRSPCYAFVHGNWALGNSARGRFCGVDEELCILRETGCYVDMTMPSAPDATQVGMINSMYTPAPPLGRPRAHRKGTPLQVGRRMEEPLFFLIEGPLLLNWNRRIRGIPVPRIENGELSADNLPTLERFRLWVSAHVHVLGRPDWVFIKLHCHGLQERHTAHVAGNRMRDFLAELLKELKGQDSLTVHFVSAREMANIAVAAVEGADGDPHELRDHCWKLLC